MQVGRKSGLRSHGFELAELLGESSGSRRKASAPSAPRYRHPENPEVTWSGRGRRPAWVTAALECGKSLEDLAI
ncbi:H-NS histone family protein [Roseicyclus elongatus]|uniref:H-NS histone family protein n=1 Tax=Roseicyclus elongatus TaxID=159346 RepID=UPI001FE236B9|nr:H-NS histone family protein [Roseibacterium elongatum]